MCNESGSTLLDTNCPSSKIHMKMNFFDKNGYFAVNFTCIATITYFRRFLTLVFVYVSSSAKSMYHICTTAVVIRVNKEKNPAIFPYLSVRRKYILNYLIYKWVIQKYSTAYRYNENYTGTERRSRTFLEWNRSLNLKQTTTTPKIR